MTVTSDFLAKIVKNAVILKPVVSNVKLKILKTVLFVKRIYSSLMETVIKNVPLASSALRPKLVNLVGTTVLNVLAQLLALIVRRDSRIKKKDVSMTVETAGLKIKMESVIDVKETVSNVFLINSMSAQSVRVINI